MSVLGAIAVVHASVATLFTLVCVYAVRSFARARALAPARPPHEDATAPRVVLLRATESVDADFAARVAGDSAAYAGDLERVVCVPSLDAVRAPLDAAVATASSGVGDLDPVNRKAAHLAAGLARARAGRGLGPGDVVVHADGDVVLAPGDIDRLVASLVRDATAGASFAAPAPEGGRFVAELVARAILVASPQAFAVVWSLARLTRSAPAMAGKLVAMRVATLDAIGGYEVASRAIADDIAMVAALHAIGARVALAPFAARTVAPARTLGDVATQMRRWMRVVGAHRPLLLVTYPFLVAPAAVSLVLACLSVGRGEWAPSCAFAALLVTRTALAATLAHGTYRGHTHSAWMAPIGALLGDAVLLSAVVAALRPAPVVWSGRRYDVGPGGRILRVRRTQSDAGSARRPADPAPRAW